MIFIKNKLTCILLLIIPVFPVPVKSTANKIIEFTSSNLPIIVIDTQGKNIPSAYKIDAHMGIIDNGPGVRNNVNDPFNNYDGKIGIEIRGSSSQMFPKKQYAVETRLENGENNNVSLLGMPEENDWVLYAPYSDKTLIRNVIAYTLANKIGRYASRTRLCEVVLNGSYNGMYVLMEKIKRDNNRVDISNLWPEEISGVDLTGGYIIKIDKTAGENVRGWTSPFPPYNGSDRRIFYQFHYPKPDEIVPEQEEYIQDFILDFEMTLFGSEYGDPLYGYSNFIDIESFVDYFLLNEISKNVDGYRLSSFFYKDREDKDNALYTGPIWDFNLAFGNADYYNGQYIDDWQADFKGYGDSFQIPFWWLKLRADKAFSDRIITKWSNLRDSIFSDDQLLFLVDSLTTLLDEAKDRDFEKWPRLGSYVWPNPYIFDTYEEEINYLESWILDRVVWIDDVLFDSVLPSDPTNFHIVSKSSSTVTLSWDASLDNNRVAGYDIYSGSILMQSTPYTTTIIKNLDEDTEYTFSINSRDDAGNPSTNNPSVNFVTNTFSEDDGYLALKTSEIPIIDGIQDSSWSENQASSLENIIGGSITDNEDLSGQFRVTWDDNRLYILLTILDDIRVDDSGSSIHEDDGIELYIDLDNSKNTSYGPDDYKFRFAYNDDTVYERIRDATKDIEFKFLDTGVGYNAEISIPWTTLGYPPHENALIGFEIQVNDDDDGGGRDAKIAWWGIEDIAYENPSAFGTIKLKNTISILSDILNIPEQFILFQNYPNPFNNPNLIWLD